MRFRLAEDAPFEALANAYGKGVLTPFTGAGLSCPVCPLWPAFIEDLEHAAGIGEASGSTATDLMRRASRATLRLRHRVPAELRERVHQAIYRNAVKADGSLDTPPAAVALARIWWPLVLTTNYDSLFLEAWNRNWVAERRFGERLRQDPLPGFTSMLPVGRGRTDCQRVLNSTQAPDNPLLWVLQGFLPAGPGLRSLVGHVTADQLASLAGQLTIGHEEYRRQTHEAVHFRRAFAEIYRSRTLLFLGSGLQESYLLDLFGEALELLGTIGHFHYALVPEGRVDTDFLARRLQILAIEYPAEAHGPSLTAFLDRLRAAIEGARPRTSRWAVKLDARYETRPADATADLAVIRGKLRKSGKKGVATAVGAGWTETGELKIGRDSRAIIRSFGADPDRTPRDRIGDSHVYRVRGFPLFIVVARDLRKSGRAARDARELVPAMREMMDIARAENFVRVDMMMLAAGSGRTFPQHIALREMIRGYCAWYADGGEDGPPLWIYVLDSRLLALLDSGRVDPVSMAGASPVVRFWIEIDEGDGNAAPILAAAPASSSVRNLLDDYAISGPGWRVSVRPAPNNDEEPQPASDLAGPDSPTLAQFGILDGSTMIFSLA